MARLDTHGVAEVLENEAAGKVKSIYDDITASFRAPTVNVGFRVLATQPDFLEIAWRQLRPNVQTIYFEQRADEIRLRAVEGVAKLGAPPRPDPEAAAVLRIFHYVDPKLLLAVCALRTAVGGSHPALQALPHGLKQQIATGVPPDAPEIVEVAPETADDAVAADFQDIKSRLGVPVVSSDFRALARWPEYMAWAWQSLKPVIASEEYRGLQRDLRRMADEALSALPFPMDLSPHTLRLCGLSEAGIDKVRQSLDMWYRMAPSQVAATAFLSVGSDGHYGAARSPFPAHPL